MIHSQLAAALAAERRDGLRVQAEADRRARDARAHRRAPHSPIDRPRRRWLARVPRFGHAAAVQEAK